MSNCKILLKKMPNFGTKNALFGYFCTRVFKNYCYIWNQYLRICLIAKFCEETKVPKFGTKNTLLGCFWQKRLIWVFLGENFKKTFVIFENSSLKLIYLQNFTEKQKCLNLGPEMPDLGNFGQEFENNIVIFEISTLEFV